MIVGLQGCDISVITNEDYHAAAAADKQRNILLQTDRKLELGLSIVSLQYTLVIETDRRTHSGQRSPSNGPITSFRDFQRKNSDTHSG